MEEHAMRGEREESQAGRAPESSGVESASVPSNRERESAPDSRDRERPRSRGEREVPQIKVFVEGRYRKLVRDLPQTVFFCPECKGHPRRRAKCPRCEGFGKLTRESVQELIGWVVGAAFKTRKNKFHGAGREDVDVRMLGGGRPFVMELVNPKVHDVDLAAVEAEINRRNEGRLEVVGLHWTEKDRVRVIKETPHAKEYEAFVTTEGPVALEKMKALEGQRFDVIQQTPARVAHRRADKARERWIEFKKLTPIEGSNELRVTLRTEHGTYVKEAIHGEGGATTPSLTQLLGVQCHCKELDVLEILDTEGEVEKPRAKPAVFGQDV